MYPLVNKGDVWSESCLYFTDMQGNIKALKYALNHELVYRDSAALLHKVGKPVPPYQKVTP